MIIAKSTGEITQWFFEKLKSLLASQDNVVVGLGGGTSFDAWYVELLSSPEWREVSLNSILWCVTDERVNCTIQERNDEHIWEVFLSPLFSEFHVSDKNFIRPMIESDGFEYSQRVENIDIAFFGMGPDGHTASLFPHHPGLESSDVGFIKINNAPKNPPERISLSPKSIQLLKNTCLFSVGTNKKEALAKFFDNSVSVQNCPAKILHPEIILDLTA